MLRWSVVAIALAGCDIAGLFGHDAAVADAPVIDGHGGLGEPAELAGMTLYHNQARAMIDTTGIAAGPLPDVEWDASLAATAAAWVAKCQDTDGNGLVDHNAGRSAGHPWYVGENIFGSSGPITAHDAVFYPSFGWFTEQVFYHYATNTCDPGEQCGHYTQLVWRTTRKVGCAIGACPGLRYTNEIVCDYGPGGNVVGEKPY